MQPVHLVRLFALYFILFFGFKQVAKYLQLTSIGIKTREFSFFISFMNKEVSRGKK